MTLMLSLKHSHLLLLYRFRANATLRSSCNNRPTNILEKMGLHKLPGDPLKVFKKPVSLDSKSCCPPCAGSPDN